MGLRNTVKHWGFFSLSARFAYSNSKLTFVIFVPGNLDGDSVPHSHGTHKISDFCYLAPHECVRSRTPTAYRELLRNYKSAGGSHYGTTKKGRKHQTHQQCNGSFYVHYNIVADIAELRDFARQLSHIGNNLNQIAAFFNSGGIQSRAMLEEINRCMTDLRAMRKEIAGLAGDYRGNLKTRRG